MFESKKEKNLLKIFNKSQIVKYNFKTRGLSEVLSAQTLDQGPYSQNINNYESWNKSLRHWFKKTQKHNQNIVNNSRSNMSISIKMD